MPPIGSSNKGSPKGKASTGRTAVNRPVKKTARRVSAAKSRTSSSPGRFSHRLVLPLLTVWILAVIILSGLIYWGGDPRALISRIKSKDYISSPVTRPAVSTSKGEPLQEHKTGAPVPAASESSRLNRGAAQGVTTGIPKPQNGATVTPASSSPAPQEVQKNTPPESRQSVDSSVQHDQGNGAGAGKPEAKPGDRNLSLALSSPAPKPPPSVPEPKEPSLTAPIGRVAIVIDDFGQDLEIAKEFASLPIPITFSVLPFERHSQEIAEFAHSHKREVMLHLPMEPQGYPKINPGSGALLLSMSGDEIRKTLKTALDFSPHITGINNHMGSRFTEHAVPMGIVLDEISRRNLYFIDSYTSSKSLGHTIARKLQIPAMRRDVFLDHNPSDDFIRSQITLLIRKAKIEGSAVAIGHPYKSTLRVLKAEAERFRQEGISVVSSRELVMGR
jgi:uncharacterized protein